MMKNEISFVHPDVLEKDRELFGFDTGDEHTIGTAVNSTTGDWMMCHLMHFAGLFSSVSIARKNGWNIPIPAGFSEFTVGKRKKKVWILNQIKEDGTDSVSIETDFQKSSDPWIDWFDDGGES